MNQFKDWGFSSQWWRGEKGEYWVLGQVVLFVGFVLLPVYPAIALNDFAPIWKYVDWGLTGVFGLMALLLLLSGILKLGTNLTPLPHPKHDGELVTGGVYAAEQRHMDQAKMLMQSYGIADPMVSDRLGEFANPELAAMYKQLVERGQTSSIEALKVAALIEETDIKDLRDRLNATNHPQLKTLYSNLLQGSSNHLQAFVRQIERQGGDYTPQVLSQQEIKTILAQGKRSG